MSKWLESKAENAFENPYSTSAIIDVDDIYKLVDASNRPTLAESFIGTFDKFCTAFVWFPINLYNFSDDYYHYLHIGDREFYPVVFPISDYGGGVKAYPVSEQLYGYSLGEYYYSRKHNDYRDYEPYTTVSLYLPYYGYTDLPTKEILNMYLQFRLYIDFKSGKAMYVIGVNPNSVDIPREDKTLPGVDDTNTRIIGQYSFQLGAEFPLGKNNFADIQRNVFLGAMRGAISVGNAISPTLHRSVTQQEPSIAKSTKTITARNKKGQFTARRKHTSEKVETKGDKITESKSYGKPLSSTSSMLVDIASGMTSTPQVERTDGAVFGVHTTQNIKIVIREAKILPVDSNYAHIYGLPLGEVKQLSQIYGYAEVSETHIEGNFGAITEEERSQIDGLLSSGVIFPNPPTT